MPGRGCAGARLRLRPTYQKRALKHRYRARPAAIGETACSNGDFYFSGTTVLLNSMLYLGAPARMASLTKLGAKWP
jgi:hypothetical protein